MTATALRMTLSAAALTAGAGIAQAQSACGASYDIRPGDTLYAVSQRCEVGLTRIMSLNADVNPRSLEVGQEIRLVAQAETAPETDTPGRDASDGYRVEPGDTMLSIAQAAGVTLLELLEANGDLDPDALPVGEFLDLPDAGETSATIRLSRDSGLPGGEVTLNARNLRPDDWVTVGVGLAASEWSAIDQARVAGDGELSATVPVPDWAEPGQSLVYVIDTDRGLTLKSDWFEVIARGGGDRDRMTLEGRVGKGAECATLTTGDGDTWALTGDGIGFTAGEHVRVSGRKDDASFCQQGLGTVKVTSITEISAPGDARDDRQLTLEGRVRQGVECMVLETDDGDTWSLTSDDVRFTAGEYVRVRGSRADASFCQQGIGVMDVATITEVSPG